MEIDIKTLAAMKDIKDGNARAYLIVLLKANDSIDIVSHGPAGEQALCLLCLENHTVSKMFDPK